MSAEKIPHQEAPSLDDQLDTPTEINETQTEPGKLIEMPETDTKLLSARDINAKMNELENHFEQLTRDFSESQGDLAATIRSLRSRNARLNKEIEKVSLEGNQRADKQSQALAETELRINDKLQSLDVSLTDAKELIQTQTEQLQRLAAAQAAFESMQQRLEKRLADKDTEIKALSQDTYQKIKANKAHIEGLQALHQDQKTSLIALSEDHDLLKEQVSDLADKVADMELEAAALKRYTSKGFKWVAAVGAGVTIALAGSITWFELNPTHAPEFVKAELATLTSTLSSLNSSVTEIKAESAQQTEIRHQLQSDIAALKVQLAELEKAASEVGGKNATVLASLQSQAKATGDQIAYLSSTLTGIQKGMEDLKFQVNGPGTQNGGITKPLIPLKGADWVAQQNPNHYSIQLVGAYQQNHLISYVNQNEQALKGKLLSFNKSKHIKRDWYNLYYGDFASFSEAQAALNALPLRLKTNYPWIRSFGAIQKGAVK